MTTMQAVQITKFGGPDVLQTADVPVPVPGPDQVLVNSKWRASITQILIGGTVFGEGTHR